AGAIKLGGGTKSGGAGADHGDLFAGADLGRFGNDPTLLPGFVDDRAFDSLYGDRGRVNSEDARAFARGRADAAGEFGKVISLVQPIEGFLPKAAIHQVVPF